MAFAVDGQPPGGAASQLVGRRLTAMKDSPVACATLGLNLTATKVGVFALSAAIAGAGRRAGRSHLRHRRLLADASLPVTMLAVVGGIGSIGGAFFGGMLLGAFPIGSTVFAANAIGMFKFFELSVPRSCSSPRAFIGISLGREPDGAAPQTGGRLPRVSASRHRALVVSVVGSGRHCGCSPRRTPSTSGHGRRPRRVPVRRRAAAAGDIHAASARGPGRSIAPTSGDLAVDGRSPSPAPCCCRGRPITDSNGYRSC